MTVISHSGGVAPPKTGTVVHVRIPEDDLGWLDRAAETRGVSRAECLRLLVAAQRRAETVDGKLGIRSATVVTGMSPTPNRTVASHSFKPQKTNPLRCECGQRKSAH